MGNKHSSQNKIYSPEINNTTYNYDNICEVIYGTPYESIEILNHNIDVNHKDFKVNTVDSA